MHELERLAPKNARPVELSAVGQHLGEAEIIANRAEQSMAPAHEYVRRVDWVGLRYVEARRFCFSGATPKAVSAMPSGSNRRSRKNAPSGRPEITSITRAATSMPTLYRQRVPGWKASGSRARSSIAASSGHWASNSLPSLYIFPREEYST